MNAMMNRQIFFSFCLLISFSVVYKTVNGHKMDYNKLNMTCDGHAFKNASALGHGSHECYEKYGLKDETNATVIKQHLQTQKCFDVCKLTAIGILDDKGAYHEAATNTFVDFMFATEVAQKMKDSVKACATKHGVVDKSLSMDNNCAAYVDFSNCLVLGYKDVCKVDLLHAGDKAEAESTASG